MVWVTHTGLNQGRQEGGVRHRRPAGTPRSGDHYPVVWASKMAPVNRQQWSRTLIPQVSSRRMNKTIYSESQILNIRRCQGWHYMLATPAHRRLRQEDHKANGSLGYIAKNKEVAVNLKNLLINSFQMFMFQTINMRETLPSINQTEHTEMLSHSQVPTWSCRAWGSPGQVSITEPQLTHLLRRCLFSQSL